MSALLALLALAVGIVLAMHHPLHPPIALAAFVLWIAASMRWPSCWPFMVPACLPAASLAPWTGWIVFDEFDLVILATLSAGFASHARRGAGVRPHALPGRGLAALCAIVTSVALVRGLAAAAGATPGWFDDYASPLNALRVGKSLLYAVLFQPLIQAEFRRSPDSFSRRFAAGMLTGALIVVSAVAWERAAYVGLLDFSTAYRTTALFWEMHVGGAAIDGDLALVWPFAAWAVARARTPLRWVLFASVALAVEYACLTTYSRGLYLGMVVGFAVLVVARSRQGKRPQPPPWRRRAGLFLSIALLGQAGVVLLGSGSFFQVRAAAAGGDLASRLAHWRHGVEVLREPKDWWFGKGLGRLPFEYALSSSDDELPGAAWVGTDKTGSYLHLSGPKHVEALAGRYVLTQRVPIEPGAYRVTLDARALRPARVQVSVCTTHLLNEGACQRGIVWIGGDDSWHAAAVDLGGPPLPAGEWPPRMAVFALSVIDVDTSVDIDHVVLRGEATANLLGNADFSHDLARWYPVAKGYFVPWHIDNFYLELLIEEGVVGLACMLLLLGSALLTLLSARQRERAMAPYLAASLAGALIVGTVSSLNDVPRVAFLMYFLALLSIQLGVARTEGAEA